MNDKNKTTHTCAEQLIISDLLGVSHFMSLHKQTRSDTISCSTHSCGFPITCVSEGYFVTAHKSV